MVVAILVAGLAVIFSSPDDTPVTVKSWSSASPVDFAQTAITELDGSSGTATYGPPYNSTTGASQSILGVSPETILGVHHPIDTANDYVLNPLRTLPNRPEVQAAVDQYTAASPTQQAAWTAAYEKAVAKASADNGVLKVPAGDYGPVGTIIGSLTSMARSGALDGALLSSRQFYGTDYTKPLLFVADGTYLADKADGQHLSGDQWGMMNETGSFPGQAWLWLYTLWYQVPPLNNSANARPAGLGHHDDADPGSGVAPLHPWAALDPPLDSGVPPDLASALPRSGRRIGLSGSSPAHTGS